MRLLVVDDHPLVREALTGVLAQLRPEAQVEGVGSARELRQALSRAPAADLVLLDLKLPDAHGMDLLAEIGRDPPGYGGDAAFGRSGCHDRASRAAVGGG